MIRIGKSKDIHRLVEGRKLILGGVEIPHYKGLLGHSDADCLTHAVIESIIGALGLKDIGTHFPDTDPKYEGVSSLILLEHTYQMMEERGYDLSDGMKDEHFVKLYENQEEAFKEFLFRLIEHMKSENIAIVLFCIYIVLFFSWKKYILNVLVQTK